MALESRHLAWTVSWLLAALVAVLGVATSSAAAGPGPETRVRANATVTVDAVGQPSSETAGGVGCLRPAAAAIASGSCVATEAVPNGEFSISNWDGYPAGGPKPEGPFRLLEGDEYSAARNAADKANSALHDAGPNLSGLQIHEVQPVKFGGSPTDLANKVVLTPAEHMQYTVWWNRVQRSIS